MNCLRKQYIPAAICFAISLSLAMMLKAGSPLQAASASADLIKPHAAYTAEKWVGMLPEGPGKELVLQKCGLCHDLHRVLAFPHTKQVWNGAIESMYSIGLTPLSSEELGIVVDYMTKYFGPHAEHQPNKSNCVQQTPEEAAYWASPKKGTYRLLVSAQMGGAIDVIDPALNKVVRRLTCVSSPDLTSISPDKSRAFIPDRAEYAVKVVDLKTGNLLKELPTIDRPQNSALSKDGKKLFVAIWPLRSDDDEVGYIEVFDTTTLKKIDTIKTAGGMHDICLTPDDQFLVAGSQPGKYVAIYDAHTHKFLWDVQFKKSKSMNEGVQTPIVETNPDGSSKRLILSNLGYAGITVIDWKTHKETRIDFNDTTAGPGKKPGGFHGVDITPDQKQIWFAGNAQNATSTFTLYGYSLPDLQKVTTYRVPYVDQLGKPFKVKADGSWLTLSPDGKLAYYAHAASDTISVVDLAGMKEIARIPVDEYPLRIVRVDF